MTLDGKVAIITGAAGGIGTAVATAMAQAGAKVSLVDHDERALQPVVLALRGRGFDVIGHVADVATPEGNREVVEDTISVFGRVDIFHANAGVAPFADLLQTTREDIDRTLAVNLVGAIHGCAAVLPAMVGQRSGVLLLEGRSDRAVPLARGPARTGRYPLRHDLSGRCPHADA
jgi:3-oxoacyl-[acyl-carrier protein] reductase